jgi:hypothetical protein
MLRFHKLTFYFNHVFVCFVCVFVHSRFVDNPSIDLEVMDPSFLGWGGCVTREDDVNIVVSVFY